MADDPLSEARQALERHDWQGAVDAADVAPVEADDRLAQAERADVRAEALWWLGRLDDCIAAREAAYALYEDLDERRRAGQCAVWLWEHNAIRARPAIAGAWLRRARRVLESDLECVEQAALLLREAEVAHGTGDLDRAIATATRALEMARKLRSLDIEAEALQGIGRVLVDRGEIATGMEHLDEAMLLAVSGRLRPFSTGKVYCSLISACEDVDDFERAAEWTDATLRWAQQHPFAIFPGVCRVHRAVVLKRRGALAEAEVEATRACGELAGSHLGAASTAYAEIGDIRRRLGDLDRAEEAFAEAQQISGGPCAALALLRVAQGRPDAARQIVTGCLEGTTHRLGRGNLLPILVQVSIGVGDLATAEEALRELDEIVDAVDLPGLRAGALSSRGRVALAQGEPEAAASALRQAVAAWHALNAPYEVATARTLLAQALREVGDDEAAREMFAAAAALFDQIGARLEADALDGGDEATGESGAVRLPAGLTAREVEVLRLVSAGLTNAEIAAQLYLSPKTVSRHLSNIFTKIGVTSRAAATAFAFGHDLVPR